MISNKALTIFKQMLGIIKFRRITNKVNVGNSGCEIKIKLKFENLVLIPIMIPYFR